MIILRSGRNAGKTKPHTKSFKELFHRIGQCTRLAPPRYADGTKLRTSFALGRWTKYFNCFIHSPHLSSGAQQPFQDFRSRRGLQEPSPLRSRQVVFRMELLNLGVHNVSVTPHLRKGLEDGCS